MINKRLTWFLESNNHISRFQSGFRSDRSTTDNLVRLETFIHDAFIKKEHVVAVFFFDLEKAYDTTWRYGIFPGESLPPCRGLWGTLHTGDDIDCNTCLLWEC